MTGKLDRLSPEQISEYHEDALISLGRQYVDYCESKKYKPGVAKKMLTAFRAATGNNNADQAILAAFFTPLLDRETIIGETNTLPLKLRGLSLPDLEIADDSSNVDAAFTWAVRRKAKKHGIGTSKEQLNHLFWTAAIDSGK